MDTFHPPDLNKPAFTCPFCGAFTQVAWPQVSIGVFLRHDIKIARCTLCGDESFWRNSVMVYPQSTEAPPANADLPEEIQNDYCEAATILSRSPRGAAALLRLCIQKLCIHLGEKGKSIDADIASLVKKGLNEKVRIMLDIVRVIGNEAVHPGTIDLNDTPELAGKLFELVNSIADVMITQPNQVDAMYDALPQEKLDGIAARDKKALQLSSTTPPLLPSTSLE